MATARAFRPKATMTPPRLPGRHLAVSRARRRDGHTPTRRVKFSARNRRHTSPDTLGNYLPVACRLRMARQPRADVATPLAPRCIFGEALRLISLSRRRRLLTMSRFTALAIAPTLHTEFPSALRRATTLIAHTMSTTRRTWLMTARQAARMWAGRGRRIIALRRRHRRSSSQEMIRRGQRGVSSLRLRPATAQAASSFHAA